MNDQDLQTPLLVTGAAGFLGQHLLPLLCQDHQVYALKLPQEDPGPLGRLPRCTFVDCVLPGQTPPVVEGTECVLHMAAMESGPEELVRAINVGGTTTMLRACEEVGVPRFVYVSSMDVAHGREDAYAKTKREAEDLVRASSLDWMIVRPTVVYGPGARALLCKLVRLAARGLPTPLPGDGSQQVQPIAVSDLAALLARVVNGPLGGRVFEVGGPRPVAYREMVELVARISGKQPLPVPLSAWYMAPGLLALEKLWPRTPLTWSKFQAATRSKTLDIGPATEALGFEPMELEQGLRWMLAEERGNKEQGTRNKE